MTRTTETQKCKVISYYQLQYTSNTNITIAKYNKQCRSVFDYFGDDCSVHHVVFNKQYVNIHGNT